MKKLILLLFLVSLGATAQASTYANNIAVVYPVIKNNEAPRKSTPVTEQKAKAPANTTNQATK